LVDSSREHDPHRVARRIFTLVTAAACIALIPWTITLAVTLPPHYVASHWRLTWVGLDTAMAFFLARTAWLTYRRRRGVVITAVITGTLLLVDAWFDVVTATGRSDRLVSLATAVFGNIPLAVVLFWAAWRVLHAPDVHEGSLDTALDLEDQRASTGGEPEGVAGRQDRRAGPRDRP
jgi:hypothetical protein